MSAPSAHEVESFFYPEERGLGLQSPDIIARGLDFRLKDALTHTILFGQLTTLNPKEWIASVVPYKLKPHLQAAYEGWYDAHDTAIDFPDMFEEHQIGNVALPVKKISYTNPNNRQQHELAAVPVAQDKRTPLTLRQFRSRVPSNYESVLAGLFGLPGYQDDDLSLPIFTKHSTTDPRSRLRQLAFLKAVNEKLQEAGDYLAEPPQTESPLLPELSPITTLNGNTNGHVNGHHRGLLERLLSGIPILSR